MADSSTSSHEPSPMNRFMRGLVRDSSLKGTSWHAPKESSATSVIDFDKNSGMTGGVTSMLPDPTKMVLVSDNARVFATARPKSTRQLLSSTSWHSSKDLRKLQTANTRWGGNSTSSFDEDSPVVSPQSRRNLRNHNSAPLTEFASANDGAAPRKGRRTSVPLMRRQTSDSCLTIPKRSWKPAQLSPKPTGLSGIDRFRQGDRRRSVAVAALDIVQGGKTSKEKAVAAADLVTSRFEASPEISQNAKWHTDDTNRSKKHPHSQSALLARSKSADLLDAASAVIQEAPMVSKQQHSMFLPKPRRRDSMDHAAASSDTATANLSETSRSPASSPKTARKAKRQQNSPKSPKQKHEHNLVLTKPRRRDSMEHDSSKTTAVAGAGSTPPPPPESSPKTKGAAKRQPSSPSTKSPKQQHQRNLVLTKPRRRDSMEHDSTMNSNAAAAAVRSVPSISPVQASSTSETTENCKRDSATTESDSKKSTAPSALPKSSSSNPAPASSSPVTTRKVRRRSSNGPSKPLRQASMEYNSTKNTAVDHSDSTTASADPTPVSSSPRSTRKVRRRSSNGPSKPMRRGSMEHTPTNDSNTTSMTTDSTSQLQARTSSKTSVKTKRNSGTKSASKDGPPKPRRRESTERTPTNDGDARKTIAKSTSALLMGSSSATIEKEKPYSFNTKTASKKGPSLSSIRRSISARNPSSDINGKNRRSSWSRKSRNRSFGQQQQHQQQQQQKQSRRSSWNQKTTKSNSGQQQQQPQQSRRSSWTSNRSLDQQQQIETQLISKKQHQTTKDSLPVPQSLLQVPSDRFRFGPRKRGCLRTQSAAAAPSASTILPLRNSHKIENNPQKHSRGRLRRSKSGNETDKNPRKSLRGRLGRSKSGNEADKNPRKSLRGRLNRSKGGSKPVQRNNKDTDKDNGEENSPVSILEQAIGDILPQRKRTVGRTASALN